MLNTLHQGEVSDGDVLAYACQVAMAMDYLHSEDLLHCDLAARSVLLSSENTVKLTDFSLSRQSGSLLCCVSPSQESKLVVRWAAPEVFKELHFSRHTDVW